MQILGVENVVESAMQDAVVANHWPGKPAKISAGTLLQPPAL